MNEIDQLTKRAVEGDKKAFGILYKEFQNEIFLFLHARTRRRDDALDLTADTFAKAFENIHNFMQKSSFKTWIFSIARNNLFDFYRKQGKNSEIIDLDDATENQIEIQPHEQNQFEILEIKMDVDELLQKLKPINREIITLRYINELNYDEISEILNITPNYAHVLTHRALNNAYEIYTQYQKVK